MSKPLSHALKSQSLGPCHLVRPADLMPGALWALQLGVGGWGPVTHWNLRSSCGQFPGTKPQGKLPLWDQGRSSVPRSRAGWSTGVGTRSPDQVRRPHELGQGCGVWTQAGHCPGHMAPDWVGEWPHPVLPHLNLIMGSCRTLNGKHEEGAPRKDPTLLPVVPSIGFFSFQVVSSLW